MLVRNRIDLISRKCYVLADLEKASSSSNRNLKCFSVVIQIEEINLYKVWCLGSYQNVF